MKDLFSEHRAANLAGDRAWTTIKPAKPAEKMPGIVANLRRAMGTTDGRVSDHIPDVTKMLRRDAPDTSRAAAAKVAPNARTLESMALSLIRLAGDNGRTFDEVAAALEWPSSQSGRITSLLAQHLIVDSGRRRLTRGGVNARVYVAVQGGAA